MERSTLVETEKGKLDPRCNLLYGSADWRDWVENKSWDEAWNSIKVSRPGMLHQGKIINIRLANAIKVAAIAHTGQKRKGTQIPYFVHVMEVGVLLLKAGCEDDVVIAGLLHDSVEDTPLTLHEISEQFGYRVAGIVEGCTEQDKSLPWEDRKKHTIEYLSTAPLEVKLVTCADKFHNITSMQEDLWHCGDELWSRFREGRDKQEWYYRGVVTALGSNGFDTHPVYSVLAKTVDKLFS